MSDEMQNDGWSTVETGATATQSGAASAGTGAAAAPAGFCQDCGRPLTAETLRNVGAGIFCEPCLAARVGRPQPPPGDASPVLAAFLGIIPGVGAMYNGQYAKGFVHLAIFAVLASLSDHIHGSIFGLMEVGWFFYQIFDAYQTAKARREGSPLPDPLGLNNIGERMGFGRTWGPVAAANPGPATPAQPAASPVPTPPVAGYASPVAGTGWVGYVPPATFAGVPPVPPVDPSAAAAAQQAPAWGHAPYAQTYTGGFPPAVPSYAAVPPVAPLDPLPPSRRLPVGAFWLIGLGLLILLANLLPEWRLGERWWPALLFAGLSVWLFLRRLRTGVRVVCILRWPVILMVLAVMFALHAAYFEITFGLTCAVLLIVIGGLLLLERAAADSPYAGLYAPPLAYTPVSSAAPAAAGEEADRARAAWAARAPQVAPVEPPMATEWDPHTDSAKDSMKGGQ
jgi:TM2 domain-containing membrane protein YozV